MTFKATKYSILALSVSLTGGFIMTMPQAKAGFQWTPPSSQMSIQQNAAPAPMPSVPAPYVQSAPPMAQPAPTAMMQAPTPPQMMPQHAPMNPIVDGDPAAPQIFMEPMAMPSGQAVQPNIVFNDTPSMMPGSSVLPQNSESFSMSGPMPTTTQAVPSVNVENGMNPSYSNGTPRRVRAEMAPQPILPSANNVGFQPAAPSVPMASNQSNSTFTPLGSSGIDFVPTHSAAPHTMMTADKMLSRHNNTAAPSTAPDHATPVLNATAPFMPMQNDTAPMGQNHTSMANVTTMQMQPVLGAPHVMTQNKPNYVETPYSQQMGVRFENAVGFGKDLPIMTAVKQIVPQDFGLSFASNVNPDMNISWQGGRPWNEALDLALAPHGLQSVINGKIVTVTTIAPVLMPAQSRMMPAQSSVMMAPILDGGMNTTTNDTMIQPASFQPASASASSSAPMSILQPAVATSGMGDNNNLYTPAAAVGGPSNNPTMQPMIGAMAPNASAYPPVSPMNPQLYDDGVQFWAAPKSSSLREVLSSWSRKAGVELYWASEYDYPISTAINIEGNFEEAVQMLLKGLSESDPRPLGRLHPNLPNGPAVLVIEARGLTE